VWHSARRVSPFRAPASGHPHQRPAHRGPPAGRGSAGRRLRGRARVQAERELERAIELDPNYATAHHWYALHLAYRGLFERGLKQAKEAQRLDPLSLIANNAASVVNGFWSRWDEVLAQSDHLISMDATFPIAHMWRGRALRAKGDLQGARAELLKAFELSGERSFELMGELGATAALAGDPEEANRWRLRLERGLAQNPSGALQLATIAASEGDKDAALRRLEQAFEAGSWFLVQPRVEPLFAPLKGEPRFEALLKRVHGP
jgi:tetratricopeptide (TPR) repeat protein